MINGVKVKKLEVKSDERGWFAEILRADEVADPKLGQFYVTTATAGQIKGKHYHTRKTEWFCVVSGNGKLRLVDKQSKEEQEIELGENNMVTVEIPPNVWHSITNCGESDMFLVAHISEPYNAEDPDTIKEEL